MKHNFSVICIIIFAIFLPFKASAFMFGVESFSCRTQDWDSNYYIPGKSKDETYRTLLKFITELNVNFIRDGSQIDNMTTDQYGKLSEFKFDTMKRLLDDLKKRKISIIWTIKATPKWAVHSKYADKSEPYNYPPSEAALKEIIDFIVRKSASYKDIIMFEIYNEPNIKHSDGWFGTVDEYINTLKTASSLLHKKNFRVMNGGMVTAITSITDPSSEGKFYNSFKNNRNLNYIAIHSHGTIDALNNDFKNNVKKYNIPASRIIITESGSDSKDERQQALHTTGKAIWAFANGLHAYSAFYLGAINPNADNNKYMSSYAMINSDCTLRPVYTAYKTAIDFLREAKFTRSYHQGSGRYEYLFVNNGMKIYAAIGNQSNISEVVKALGSSKYKVYDMLGRENGKYKEIQYFVSGKSPKITTSTLKAGTINKAYNLTLKASGAGPGRSFIWKASGLPKGLKLVGNKITGTPKRTGKFNVTLTVSSKCGSYKKKLLLIVKPSFKTSKLSPATIGEKYNFTFKASGNNLKFSCTWNGKSIKGLKFTNGKLSGTPSIKNKPGNYKIKITVAVKNCPAAKVSRTFTIKLAKKSAKKSDVVNDSHEKLLSLVNSESHINHENNLLVNTQTQTQNQNINITNRSTYMKAETLIYINGKEYIIACVLDSISVSESSESGQYDLNATIHENIRTGAKLIWQANPVNADYSEDDEIADFYDSKDYSPVESVPESHLITVSAWLRPGVIYEPVIVVEAE